jgi:hypothetical protein
MEHSTAFLNISLLFDSFGATNFRPPEEHMISLITYTAHWQGLAAVAYFNLTP